MTVMDDSYRSDRSSFSTTVNQNARSQSPNATGSASSDWMWRVGSWSGPAATGPTPMNYQPYPYGQYPDLNNASLPPQPGEMPTPKIAIPRATAAKVSSQRRRSARACEPCRQRKVKCDGGRPVCRKCREHGMSCSYIDIKRIRDQKQLGVLSDKVVRYEKLLRQLEAESEPTTAKRIKKALATLKQLPSQTDDGEIDDSDADSTTSHGSLEEIDLVKEDLNRSDKTVATGFFGKNSEVAWMQKLEDVSDQRLRSESEGEKLSDKSIPIMSMSYHLDDLAIQFPDSVDMFAVPEKELADQYFNAYMESVQPTFTVIRKNTFTAQYEQFFRRKQFTPPPRKWLAVLNMIFALGCRYCMLTCRIARGARDTNDLEFLDRARKLCLTGNVLFEHDDLQQIQVMLLVAFYLVALGQVNRASKFSSMAMRSAISLGINLRFKDDKTHYASKEARTRLWWSIFLLEHLITSITGRVSGCGTEVSAALLPVPFDEEGTDGNPGPSAIFYNRELPASHLQMALFQTEEEAQSAAAWIAKCEPSPTLLFHCIVDLSVIGQTIINSVYSVQSLRESSGQLEQRLQKLSGCMDVWLHKVPLPYRFTVSPEDDSYHLSPGVTEFIRERITLAMYYYSARITLCRPCLSHSLSTHHKAREASSRASYRAMLNGACLRASIFLLSILPEKPDTVWLTTVTPWWTILHFIMQATTALLIGLLTQSCEEGEPDNKLSLLNRDTMIQETKKAVHWIHHLAYNSRAARRAFILCERFLTRMGPSLGLDVADLPSSEAFPPRGSEIDMLGSGDCSGSGSGSGSGSSTEKWAGTGLAMVDD